MNNETKALSTAQTVCELMGEDGQRFETKDGRNLREVALNHGADVQYGREVPVYDEDGARVEADEPRYERISRSQLTTVDGVRYAFADGSAIVVWGDAWDIEGARPFSWAGLERQAPLGAVPGAGRPTMKAAGSRGGSR